MRIEDLMSREVVTISPEAALKDVAETFLVNAISGAPVCDSQNRVLGVISQSDLLRKAGGPGCGRRTLRSRRAHTDRARTLAARTAGEGIAVRTERRARDTVDLLRPCNAVACGISTPASH